MSSAQEPLITDNYESVSSTASKKSKKKKGKSKSTNAAAGSVNGVLATGSGNVLNTGGGYDPEGSEDFDSAMDSTEGNYGYPYPTNPSGQAMPSGATPLFSSALSGGFEADPRSTTYSALNLTHQDLLNTANELYRRMEDPQFGNDDAYWTSLPVHLRNFIKNALPLAGNLPGVAGNTTGSLPLPPLSNSVNRGEQAMYAMAQQIVSAANQGMGLGQSVGNGLLMGNASMYPPGTGAGAAAAGAGLGKQPANGMQQHGMMNGIDQREMPGAMPTGRDGTTVSLDDGDYDSDVDSITSAKSIILDASAANPGQTEAMSKKKKKKKKKGNAESPFPIVVVEHQQQGKPTAAPARAQQLPAVNGKAPTQLPPPPPRGNPPVAGAMYPPAAQNTGPRPPAAVHANATAPPSSRAAGKQPMLNAATPAANAQAQSQNNAANSPTAPVRSARSAGKAPLTSAPLPHTHPHPPGHNHAGHNHPPSKATSTAGAPSKGKATAPALPPKIWQPSSSEEREHIKSFWLSLNQNERQDLVRVEKDAVLRKMKEQQRHSCGCAVCGRKRSAIEQELETLYDAYYDELERYADHQAQYASTPGALPAPLGPGPFPGSVEVDANGQIVRPDHLAPVRRPPNNAYHDGQRHHKGVVDDIESEEEEDFDDEGYDEDDDEDDDVGSDEADMGDEDDEDLRPRPGVKKDSLQPPAKSHKAAQPKLATDASGDGTDFFSFSSGSLTTMKGILTVADDLLKNDGAKFLEMMEQLAARRMMREDMAIQGLEEEDLDEEEEEEDDEDDEDLGDDDEDDDDPVLSQSERMEEGRRMFQIFAARMFEQRVLQKYRERIAEEQSRALLSELEMEQNAAEAAAARRQKEAAKKKEKKRLQKQAKEEERLKKEQEAREEASAARAKQEAADREAAKKREEEKQRREAEKRAKQEELIRKEEEKRKRVAEDREREAEALRKKREREEAAKAEREAKEKEKKDKEEKDRLAREIKEKEAKVEKERLLHEAEAKKEAARKAKELAEEQEKERQAAAIAQAQARLLQQQKSAAARSAHIAQQAAKVAKPAKASSSANPPTRAAKQPARSISSTPVSAPATATVGQSSSSSRSSSPPKQPISVMPTPNVRPPPTSRTASTAPASGVQQPLPQQVIAQQAFGTAIQAGSSPPAQGSQNVPGPYGLSRSSLASPSVSPAVALSAQAGMSGSSASVQPNPFPSQVPGYGGPRGPATSPGAYGNGNLPVFGQMVNMQPSPVFGQAMPGPNTASPAQSRSYLSDNTIDGALSAGLRNVGLGHPSKSGRSPEDMVFSPPGGPMGTARMPSDQEPSLDFRQSFSAGPIGPGPIQPIGRPRPTIPGLDILDEAGPSSSTSRRSSPPLAEKVLGSAALGAGDDDEVLGPAPRRVSNTAALGASWSTSAIAPGGGGGQWGNSGFSPSPGIWGGSSTVAQSAASANWPTSTSAFGQQTRFDVSKSAAPGPIGHMPTHGINRGFNAGNPVVGPPGMAFGQTSGLFSPPQSGSQSQTQQTQQSQQSQQQQQHQQQQQQHH